MSKGIAEARTQAEKDGKRLSVLVLDYVLEMKRLLDEAKTNKNFADADWAPLKAMVAANEFRRVGVFLEDITWQQYESFLTTWAKASDWVPTFRRITEAPGVVLLELAEWSNAGGKVDEIKSVSVYEFNAANKLSHLDIYMQRKLDNDIDPKTLLRKT